MARKRAMFVVCNVCGERMQSRRNTRGPIVNLINHRKRCAPIIRMGEGPAVPARAIVLTELGRHRLKLAVGRGEAG